MLKIISGLCTSSRDCFDQQLCIDGTCRQTCYKNNTCPSSFYCDKNKMCTKSIKCLNDEDCETDELCSETKNGISECIKLCHNQPCGRNAFCVGLAHKPICSCKEGFFGDPLKGCDKKECDEDKDCSEDKTCHNNMCKIACLYKNECGDNTICSSENHKHVCYCQPGYTGNPISGCVEINWCEVKPCGIGAECINTKSEAKCACPSGTVGNPYSEGCHISPECRFNRDCPSEARCTIIDGVRKCTGKKFI